MYKYLIFDLLLAGILFSSCGGRRTKPTSEKQFWTQSAINQPIKEIIRPTDKAKMVLIPEGNFQMGDALKEPEEFMIPSLAIHKVSLNAFYIDVCKVTLGQYKRFLKATAHLSLPNWVKK